MLLTTFEHKSLDLRCIFEHHLVCVKIWDALISSQNRNGLTVKRIKKFHLKFEKNIFE